MNPRRGGLRDLCDITLMNSVLVGLELNKLGKA